MFAGHYGPALALARPEQKIRLWHLVVAVQLLDYLWATFILTGVEDARVEPGFLAASHLDLYHMPLTHSLVGSLAISIVAGAIYALVLNRKARLAGGIIIAAAVFSHWLADLLVHAPDLELYPGSEIKLGFGLWESVIASQGAEFAFVLAGTLLYVRATEPKNAWGRVGPWVLLGIFIVVNLYNLTAPPPPDIKAVAVSALIAYSVFAALAFAVETGRRPKEPTLSP